MTRRGSEEGKGDDISSQHRTVLYSSPLVPVEGSQTLQPCLILLIVRGLGLAPESSLLL